MMERLTLDDIPDRALRGRRVLVRVDFNVPLDERREVADDTRIRATLPTLRRLVDAGARVILLSHLGRPKGRPDPALSLLPAARRLGELLDAPVDFVGDTTGEQALRAADELQPGAVIVLENTRFLPGEEANDAVLARAFADLGDHFVNDAFGTAHRAHASTTGVADLVRGRGGLAAAGLLMKRELEYLGGALDQPRRPFVAVLGGAKISGKIDVIEALLPKVDVLQIGGAMANTFFRAMGVPTGASLVEDDRVPLARELIDRAGPKLMLPDDLIVAPAMKAGAETRKVARDAIPEGWMALDVGEATVARYRAPLLQAATILWNGPMGVSEIPEFRAGTAGVARALVDATAAGVTTIVGGGDSAAALSELGLEDGVTHVSTGGGASLEFLEGRTLPGVAALSPATEAP